MRTPSSGPSSPPRSIINSHRSLFASLFAPRPPSNPASITQDASLSSNTSSSSHTSRQRYPGLRTQHTRLLVLALMFLKRSKAFRCFSPSPSSSERAVIPSHKRARVGCPLCVCVLARHPDGWWRWLVPCREQQAQGDSQRESFATCDGASNWPCSARVCKATRRTTIHLRCWTHYSGDGQPTSSSSSRAARRDRPLRAAEGPRPRVFLFQDALVIDVFSLKTEPRTPFCGSPLQEVRA